MTQRFLTRSAAAALAAFVLAPLAPQPLVSAAFALTEDGASPTARVQLTIEGYDNRDGHIWIGVYASEADWDAGEEAFAGSKAFNGEPLVAEFELDAGEYAIRLFHDEDADGDFDTGMFGIPAERYGFSNGVRPRFRGARWDEAVFTLEAGATHAETIDLQGAMD
ncbi:MAG: DUF2141 domain-containing protein [Pseudomonadota bacterium]